MSSILICSKDDCYDLSALDFSGWLFHVIVFIIMCKYHAMNLAALENINAL